MSLRAVIVRLLLAVIAFGGAGAPSLAGNVAVDNRLLVVEESLDLGEVAPGLTVNGAIRLRNVGHRAIGIVEATTTCRCTIAAVTPRVVEPERELTVAISLEAPQHAGEERTAEVRLTTTEGQEIVRTVRLRTAPALAVTSLEVTTLQDGSTACQLEIESIDGAAFHMVGLGADEHPSPTPDHQHSVLVTVPTTAEGQHFTVLQLRTTHPLQPTITVPIGDALIFAGVDTTSLRRASVRPSPPSLSVVSEPSGAPLSVTVDLPGWTDDHSVTRLSWTNAALGLKLESVERRPGGAIARISILDTGGGRRSFDHVTLTSPSFQSQFRLTVRRESTSR